MFEAFSDFNVSVPFQGPILLIADKTFTEYPESDLFPPPFGDLFFSSEAEKWLDKRGDGLFPSPFGDLFFSSNDELNERVDKVGFRPLSGTYSSHPQW